MSLVEMSDDLRARAHNFVEYFEQQLRYRLRAEERAALKRIVAAKFGFDDDAFCAAVEAERAKNERLREALAPFATAASGYESRLDESDLQNPTLLTVGMLRRARIALRENQ